MIGSDIRRLFKGNRTNCTKEIVLCMADHFEPKWNGADAEIEKSRVNRWKTEYPKFADKHRDSSGRPLQHTWFYAAEQYNPDCLEALASLCRLGYGEIELHLHHDQDTPEGFRDKLEKAKRDFSRHGALITRGTPTRYAFGFIHGNWALNNSRGGKWCGVNNELKILKDAGCYADFTLPSAPNESQTRISNSIYYARDIHGIPKSHDTGRIVFAGGGVRGDLMLIQGPLTLNWSRRKYFIFPKIENSSIHRNYPGTPDRIRLWIRQHIHVQGRPEWVFIKLHCHGGQEDDYDVLLGKSAHKMFSYLEENFNDGEACRLHYVTAREMFNIIKAAEDGRSGNPSQYRDYAVKPYICSEASRPHSLEEHDGSAA
ncbi:MAG: hypothetical protein ACE14T_11840 [Syntrophales bacterium]